MDGNAKNKLWGSSRTDKKGVELEHLIVKNNLNVANVPNSKLEYIPSKISKVDVTLYGDKVKISGWKFLNTVSLSDTHTYTLNLWLADQTDNQKNQKYQN